MEFKIALIPGDGIGPEIVREAKKVLDKVCEKYHHTFTYDEVLLGGASIDAHGVPLTEEAVAQAKVSDAVLMGSIGGDAKTSPWYKLEPSKRPEAGLLAIRKALNLFANLRPAYLYNELKAACPLREDIIGDGFDMIIVRELTGGLYFGERKTIEEDGVKKAIDTLAYNENEIRRIAVKIQCLSICSIPTVCKLITAIYRCLCITACEYGRFIIKCKICQKWCCRLC